MKDESWVTLAQSDAEGWAASVLGRSIRTTFTKRRLTVVISENVSPHIKVLLQRVFDSVVRYDSMEVGNKAYGKLWVWNLKSWNKCVYLDPFSIMLKNSDELFAKSPFSAALLKNDVGSAFDCSLFVFRPNVQTFEALLDSAANIKADSNLVLQTHFKLVATTPNFQIDQHILMHVKKCDSKDGVLDAHVVAFDEIPWKINTNNCSVESAVHKWITTFVHEVIPEVGRMKDSLTKACLLACMEKNELPASNGPATPSPPIEDLGELREAIAIIGMSCRFPGANNADEFWNLLVEGEDPIRKFPPGRPHTYMRLGDEKCFEAGFLKCAVDEFDAKFFGISPREAPFVDPQQRVLLEVIWESLENANVNPHSLKESNTGVFVGIWQQDYDKIMPSLGLSANDFHHRYLGNAFSATASRISYFLGLFGPNYSIESGCSSSSSGIHLACESLRRGETSLAIASGVNLVLHLINPLGGDDKSSIVFADDYRCKTFDESANGFVRAEGCGAIVLKPLVDAVRDGDELWGIIRGTALNNDGPGTSFGTPNAKAQERVFREALANAQVEPHRVSLVEAHGTGTIVGDPTEMHAIGQVYSEGRTEPLFVGSVKTNIGHTEACAGMAGLIKVLLSMKHKTIPPHLHFNKLNPRINLESIPAQIPLEATPWVAETRIAAVSSFSMSGTNVHMILQETPPALIQRRHECTQQPLHMLGISAKSEEALEELSQKYITFLEEHRTIPLADIAYTLNTGRANLPHRIAVIAKDTEQLLTKLKKRSYTTGKAATQTQKIVFLFTGQGSQYFGMGRDIYDNSADFRLSFEWCDDLFKRHMGTSLRHVLWEDSTLLEQTIYCQPAIFCVQYALLKLWESFGIRPDFVLGHSVGEFCAAVCAGVLSVEDAMKLVVGRSKLVYSLPQGGMLAVKASPTQTRHLIREYSEVGEGRWLDVAAENSQEEVVVSGTPHQVQAFAEFCVGREVKSQNVLASHAFHSRQMDAVLEEFGLIAAEVVHGKLSCGYISGTLAREMKAQEFGPNYWKGHLRDTVKFEEALKIAWKTPVEGRLFLEVGTQPILLGLALANIHESSTATFCPTLRKSEEDVTCVLNSLSRLFVAGGEICWRRWFGRGNKVTLPTYAFQRQKYWYTPEGGLDLKSIEFSTPLLHPLLGRQIPSPVSDHIFSHVLSIQELPYVEEHRVGERVILPAAAYLEAIMIAGCEVLQGGRVQVPFTVDDLLVEAALELRKPCQVQTVVHSVGGEEGAKFEIAIHKQVSTQSIAKWKRHALAFFSPSVRAAVASIDLPSLIDRMTLKDSTAAAYEALAKVGIQFGPKFQSIAKAWSGTEGLLTEIAVPEDGLDYICHPIVLDAMIQTFAFRFALTSAEQRQPELQLPISIKKFTWLSREVTKRVMAHTPLGTGESRVTLYNERGEALAIMEGLELLRTNVGSFLRILNTEANNLPGFMEEVWRPTSGVTRARVNPKEFHADEHSPLTSKCLAESLAFEEHTKEGYAAINQLFFLFLVRGVQECHWPWPCVGEWIKVSDWGILAPAALQICRSDTFLRMFEQHGYLEATPEHGLYKVRQKLLSLDECEAGIRAAFPVANSVFGEEDAFVLYARRCGLHLTSVLQGRMTPVAYLFPADVHEVGALRFYNESTTYKFGSQITPAVLADAVTPTRGTGILRILEVGAGSGISCQQTIDYLVGLGIPFHYTFTDISPMFLHEARKKFTKGFSFEVLNIEEDPLTQGFGPEQFDVVLAVNVIHATADIQVSLRNMRTLLRPAGLLTLGEQFKDRAYIVLSFGFMEGWWRFNDFRTQTPLVSQHEWESCLTRSGFSDVRTFCNGESSGTVYGRKCVEAIDLGVIEPSAVKSSQKSWFLISDDSKLESYLREKLLCAQREVIWSTAETTLPASAEGILFMWTTYTTPLEVEQKKAEDLLRLCQKMITTYQEVKQKPILILVTRGVNYLTDAGVGNPNAATAVALLKSFCNENEAFRVSVIDADQDEVSPLREAEEIFAQLWTQDREMFKTIREDKMFVQRLVCEDKRKMPIPLPNSSRFALLNPPSKSFVDLEIVVAPRVEPTEDQVEVAVRAAALNFRDIFMILQPDGFEIPAYMDKAPGLDVSGVVTAVGPTSTLFNIGDEVFGFTSGGGLASHVVVSERALIRKPLQMTFTSACTIPCAFLTVLYSLCQRAKLTAGDRVLIHVATGGVGLAAIQVAKHIGAKIYATAGSRRKRGYLQFLGIRNVYHSRNTDFGDEILRDSDGAGVTVVLNSLTGPNFKETSLRACAEGARFIEIGKVNIWSEEDVANLRPDVKYFVIDLATMAYDAPQEFMSYTDVLGVEFQKGIYTGLPHDTFPLDLAREAFHYFQEAKHIGKVVLTIPETRLSPDGRITFHHQLFNPQSTYLITGGLGGLGLEVTKWMTTRGAKSIVLTGRSFPNEKALELIHQLNTTGSQIVVIQSDVGELRECTTLLDAIQKMGLPPLRGIMHAAGVLSDGIFLNQVWSKVEATFRPKVQGTWNLHQLTLGYELEFFAMFSSIAALLGMVGQSNHAAANGFMDSFAHYRLSLGLPALTMNFGPWSDVRNTICFLPTSESETEAGIVYPSVLDLKNFNSDLQVGAAANIKVVNDALIGAHSFSPTQGVAAIEKIFRERCAQSAIFDVMDWTVVKQLTRLGRYLDEMKSEETGKRGAYAEYASIMEDIKAAPPNERQSRIEDFLEKILKETLRIPESEALDRDQNFSEIGVDSLMAMELRNQLQGLLGEKQLTVGALQEKRTIRSLSAHMAALMDSDGDGPIETPLLVAEDSILHPDIQPTATPPTNPSHFAQILLTGATGHLGTHFIPSLQQRLPHLLIHCLVRGKNEQDATARLKQALKLYSLLDTVDMGRITIHVGDVTKENFALPPQLYQELSIAVDAIINCAIKSNHLADYGSGGETSLRNHNVTSTVNILKFAGTGKTKHVLHASSLLAVTTASEDGTLSEEFPTEDDMGDQIRNGYILSKFVSEKLLSQAFSRGIPVTVFRYASIFGNSESGFLPTHSNHAWGILLSCIRVRKFPNFDQNGIPLMAVDTAAHLSTKIFLNDSSEMGMYNLTSASVASAADIKEVFAKFGVDGDFVAFPVWRDLVFQDAEMDNVLAPFSYLYGESGENQNYIRLHPLATVIHSLRMCHLSEKVKNNCPFATDDIVPTKTLLERHLKAHYDKLRTQK